MKKIPVFVTAWLCIFCLSLVYSTWLQGAFSHNLIRLHIVANSDSEYDQRIKLDLRDEILAFTRESHIASATAYEAVANKFLKKINAPYGASANFEYTYVPKKSYKTLSLPQGKYNCIEVSLGNGTGENWWCIAYPPLCYTEDMFGDLSADGKAQLEKILNGEAMSVATYNGGVNFRLKIVDEMQKLIKIMKI